MARYPWWISSSCILLACIAVRTTPVAAASSDDSRADICMQEKVCRELVQRATEQYQARDFEPALDSYQAAYARFPLPALLFNIARTQHQLGRLDAAQQNYKLVLIQTNDEALRTKVQGYLTQLEDQRTAKSIPPEPAKAPAPSPSVTAAALQPRPNNQTDASGATPLYKRWWLWTAVGAAAAAGAVGLIIGTQVDPRPVPATVIDLRNRF